MNWRPTRYQTSNDEFFIVGGCVRVCVKGAAECSREEWEDEKPARGDSDARGSKRPCDSSASNIMTSQQQRRPLAAISIHNQHRGKPAPIRKQTATSLSARSTTVAPFAKQADWRCLAPPLIPTASAWVLPTATLVTGVEKDPSRTGTVRFDSSSLPNRPNMPHPT